MEVRAGEDRGEDGQRRDRQRGMEKQEGQSRERDRDGGERDKERDKRDTAGGTHSRAWSGAGGSQSP